MSEIKLKSCHCCGAESYTRFTALKDDELHGFVSCNNPKCALKMSFENELCHQTVKYSVKF